MQYGSFFNLPFFKTKFIRYLRRENYAKETIAAYTTDLKSFISFMYNEYEGNILMEQITLTDLSEYLVFLKDERGLAASTAFRHLSTLKTFYRFLTNEMGFKENIASKIRHKTIYTALPPILTKEEIETLLETAKKYDLYFYVFFASLYYTGSRVKALTKLLKEDINFNEKKLYFSKIKGGMDLYLPLHDKLYNILKMFVENHPAKAYPFVFHSPRNPTKPIDAQTVRNHLKTVKNLTGIEKRVTPHILRHSMATHLTVAGVDQRFLMEILGHSDPRATSRYQRLVVENLRDPINQLA